jgi:hypothetical protein
MAGTTTRLGLPYPTGTDTPDVPRDVKALTDKLDPNVALDLHGTLGARPAAGLIGRYYTDDATGFTYRDNGTAWVPLNAAAPGISGAFPSTPYDGQEVAVVIDATAGVCWRFKYRAASASAYKWEFVGGPPLLACDSPITNYPLSQVATPAVCSPNVTIPRDGDYLLTSSGQIAGNAGAGNVVATPYFLVTPAAAGPNLTDLVQNIVSAPGASIGSDAPYSSNWRLGGLVAGATVHAEVRWIAGTGAANAGSVMVQVLPIRVR